MARSPSRTALIRASSVTVGILENSGGKERLQRLALEWGHTRSRALNHPHIAQIYGFEEFVASDGDRLHTRALVMELVEGQSLADRIAAAPLLVKEALLIAVQIAEALESAHERGIIHRDLKPANIHLTAGWTVKVLDFGLAKVLEPLGIGELDPFGLTSPPVASFATHSGVILGTAAFMSPEQARGQPVDKRADIWAFGVVLYEMLTRRRPFEGETISARSPLSCGRKSTGNGCRPRRLAMSDACSSAASSATRRIDC